MDDKMESKGCKGAWGNDEINGKRREKERLEGSMRYKKSKLGMKRERNEWKRKRKRTKGGKERGTRERRKDSNEMH
jgi:hypothetical protein